MPDTPAPKPDPPDAELIAYLDGELDGTAARRVEARLARDPAARAAAQAYKKTFDLLDALPQPEPKPDFTARTVTRLEPADPQGGRRTAEGGTETSPVARRRPPKVLVLTVCTLIAAFCVPLFGHYVVGPVPLTGRDDDLQFSDLSVIERLPLYLGVDDLEFVRRLDDPALFAPHEMSGPPVEPPLFDRDKLTALFKSAPPARQQQLRRLDQEWHDQPDADRVRLGRVLEGYAVWLDRLPDPERKAILAAPSADARLEAVRGQVVKGRREALPAAFRKQLDAATLDERLTLQTKRRDEDQANRDEWQLARRQWEAVTQPGLKPWPFADPILVDQVDEFLRNALRAEQALRPLAKKEEIPITCRLLPQELNDLRQKRIAAKELNNWFVYGLQVYRLAEKYPYLPPPVGKPVTEPEQIVSKRTRLVTAAARSRGKWPDYALAISDSFRRAGVEPPANLGPAKREDFPKPLQEFVNQTLITGLTSEEVTALNKLEGKWPDYPQEIVRLAKKYDYSVPGVTLPGKPREWAKYYALKP